MKSRYWHISPWLIAMGLGIAAGPSWALTITGVGAEPRAFNPNNGEGSEIRFQLDQPATMTLRFYDLYERMVRAITSPGELKPGGHSIVWDGRDQAGPWVPAEAYHYTLEAQGRDASDVTYDLTDLTGGETLAVGDIHWEPETSLAHYTLTKPARVNLRAGIRNYGPLLNTLLDWMPRQAGRHSIAWDGWDASRVLQLTSHPKLELRAAAYTLSRNTLFVLPLPDKAAASMALPWGEERRQARHNKPIQARDYARQPAEERRDVPLSLKLVSSYPAGSQGVARVTGRVPIRIDVAEERHTDLFKQRFEPVFFVDGVFLSEIEVGFLPTTYVWDSRDYSPGIHYLTVNIVGYEGSMGSATIKLKVEEQR